MLIQVLGPGCPKCEQTLKFVQDVVAEKGLAAKIEKITDFEEIARMGVFSTPGVIVNGAVKVAGRAPSRDEIEAWLGG